MRRITWLVIAFSVLSWAGTVLAAKPDATYNLTGWKSLDMTSGRIVASGGSPAITTGDGKMRLLARRVVLSMAGGTGKGVRAITTAEATGGVKLSVRQSPSQTIDAVSDKAVIIPAQDQAILTGNVKIVQKDPTKLPQPIVLTGDSVTLYLKEGRIVAKSRPGKSRLSATPKSGAKP